MKANRITLTGLLLFALVLGVACRAPGASPGPAPTTDPAPAPTPPPAPVKPRALEFEPGSERGELGRPLRLRHTSTGIVLLLVEPGTFTMGSLDDEENRDGDEFRFEVTIEEPFYLAETEVTAGQWTQVMGEPPEYFHDDPELPASGISWHAAQEFIARLNADGEGGEGRWRLPREREWEYACRAGTTSTFFFGEELTIDHVNYNDRYPYRRKERGERSDGPVPVRSLPPNPWGFYEIHGNVWEWCEDFYSFDPRRSARERPGDPRVMRGGAFTSKGKQIRSAYRDGYPPNSSGPKYGFRLARTVAPE